MVLTPTFIVHRKVASIAREVLPVCQQAELLFQETWEEGETNSLKDAEDVMTPRHRSR